MGRSSTNNLHLVGRGKAQGVALSLLMEGVEGRIIFSVATQSLNP